MSLTDYKNLKEWHGFFLGLKTWNKILAALLLVFGIAGYLVYHRSTDENRNLIIENQNLRDENSALNTKLTSIQRRFGNSESFQIKKILASKSDPNSIPAASSFFPEDRFYAPMKDKNLSYRKINALEFGTTITGESPDAEIETMYRDLSLHQWRAGKIMRVKNNSIFSNLVACVSVGRADIQRVKEEIGTYYDNEASPAKELHKAQVLKFDGDVVGFAFALQSATLYLKISSVANTREEMVSVQKLDNVLYSQTRITLKDATVDGVHYPEYYVHIDMALVSVPPSLYTIVSVVPTSEPAPRGVEFDWINQWFNQFAILTD